MDAEAFVRSVLAIADTEIRRGYVRAWLRDTPIERTAVVLERVCAQADQAEARAEEALLSIVDALFAGPDEVPAALRSYARQEKLLSLERLVRHSSPPAPHDARVAEVAIPDYGYGRPLTLGERKSLARRPTRALIDRLLLDPHPDVLHRLLANPRLTEDDVARLAARRPGRPDVLAEIARSPKWLRSRRVRVSLACNPDAPVEVATRVVRLLVRPDLTLVASSPNVPAEVRTICLELLERRPPSRFGAIDPKRIH